MIEIIEIIGRGLIVAFLLAPAPYLVGYWFTRGMMDARIKGPVLATTLVVLPAFGYPVTVTHALGIGVVFTIISVARSYVVRRYFNARIVRFAQRLAEAR